MNQTETRTTETEIRVIAEPDKPTKLVGYAAKFNKLSEVMTSPDGRKFREQIQPGAFADYLASGAEIKADVGHGQETVFARRSRGTLNAFEDGIGLYVEAIPRANHHVLEDVAHGDMDQMSFAFRVKDGGQRWERQGDEWIRTLTKLDVPRVNNHQ